MKKLIFMTIMLATSIGYTQKKSNGTIYIEHPAITVVADMNKAFVAGDTQKLATYLSDDFAMFDGINIPINDKGSNKKQYLDMAKMWHDQLIYYSIKTSSGSYPDALEYKKEENKNEVWVQTWDKLKGVHKASGVKVDMELHRLFVVNKDNKISKIINYMDSNIGKEIRESMSERTNGTIYNQHEFINTVKKMLFAFENNDLQTAYSYYSPDCTFNTLSNVSGNGLSLDEQKKLEKDLLQKFEIRSFEVIGYPDYLHYELADSHVVLSWWTMHLMRKSDKKEIAIPMHYSHTFNKEGQITSEMVYFDERLLE